MLTHNLGYPRIGGQRELKRACEQFWAGEILLPELLRTGRGIRRANWSIQKDAGIQLIPSNDFSFYDHVLDTSLMVGNIPSRFKPLLDVEQGALHYLYFAMARGYQDSALDITALEMTKWFDTNYHYLVPEFTANQSFEFLSSKVIEEFIEAKNQGIITKPVLLGPVSYLLLGKEKEPGFHRIELLDTLLPVYQKVLNLLQNLGADWVQIDEPCLVLNLDKKVKDAYLGAYEQLSLSSTVKILLATYFGGLEDNAHIAMSLPVAAIHIDAVRSPEQVLGIANIIPGDMALSLGIVDGRNIWKNNFNKSLCLIDTAMKVLGDDRLMIAPSCSLLHVPCDLDLEVDETILRAEVKTWMAFAKQKILEIVELARLREAKLGPFDGDYGNAFKNQRDILSRQQSTLVHNREVQKRLESVSRKDYKREAMHEVRKIAQQRVLNLPFYPTTTIGSFPQTRQVRELRSKYRKGLISIECYKHSLQGEIQKTIRWQEDVGIDVLVHGEFERNDMVEYFGELLNGFAFTQNGWVQSYGTRCVKPPVIYGDVSRPTPMTVEWTAYAQSLTSKPVKGMLTGPVTILQWSFVRDDQPRSVTATQIALAIRDEVLDLERVGINIIQVDEPAIREGLPIRTEDWAAYLGWAVKAFRLSVSGVQHQTQIHTHMCYSEFNDIIEAIAAMDADVITIETSRSQMELLDAFAHFK